MRWQAQLSAALVAALAGTASSPLCAQGVGMYLAPRDQVIAVKAAQMFDSRTGALVSNPVVLIKGDRITDVGANLAIPAGTRVIDLGTATMMPGMIDAHVHVNTGGNAPSLASRALRALANAQIDLDAGFTTVLDMDSRGTFYTVDLRDAIKSGIARGPRMQVVGQSLNPRATNYYPDNQSVRTYEAYTESKNVNGPWLARSAVREAKLDLIHVPFRSSGGTLPALIGDQINAMFGDVSLLKTYVQAGKITPLAIASPQRSPLLPELVTMAEAGLPGIAAENWYGLVVSSRTPPAVVMRLRAALLATHDDPAYQESLIKQGISAGEPGAESFDRLIRQEVAKWKPIVTAPGFKIE